jgi:LysR family transcriptional regulator, nitrogen assimilation regulatory protein
VNLRQLDYFVHVAELGSFSRAASQLSIAQSALSHKVRQLEIELKQPLLLRNGRGVTPTEAGRRLLVHARGIIMQVNRTRDELAEFRGMPAGHVVVALPPTIALLLTVLLVKNVRAQFPNGSISIMEGRSMNVVEWVTSGRADIGVVFNPQPSPAIDITPWLEEPMLLIGPKQRRAPGSRRSVPLKELPHYPLIVASRPNANRMRIESQLAYFGLKPTIAIEIDGLASALELVHQGYGYAVLPRNALRGYGMGRALAARPIVRPKLWIQLSLVTSAQRPVTTLTSAVLRLLPEIGSPVLSGSLPANYGHR